MSSNQVGIRIASMSSKQKMASKATRLNGFHFIISGIGAILGVGFSAVIYIMVSGAFGDEEAFSKADNLLKKLERIDIGNKTVILGVLTQGYVSFVPLWLKHTNNIMVGTGKKNLTEHFLILNFDGEAYTACKSFGLNCWLDDSSGASLINSQIDSSKGPNILYGTTAFKRLMWRRMDVMHWILTQGFSIVFADMDVIWIKDPFPLFDECDFQLGSDGNRLNAGFWYLRNSPHALSFFEDWAFGDPCRFKMDDQDRLERMFASNTSHHDLLVRRFHPDKIRSGCDDKPGDEDLTYTFHPTCVIGLPAKIALIENLMERYHAAVARKAAPSAATAALGASDSTQLPAASSNSVSNPTASNHSVAESAAGSALVTVLESSAVNVTEVLKVPKKKKKVKGGKGKKTKKKEVAKGTAAVEMALNVAKVGQAEPAVEIGEETKVEKVTVGGKQSGVDGEAERKASEELIDTEGSTGGAGRVAGSAEEGKLPSAAATALKGKPEDDALFLASQKQKEILMKSFKVNESSEEKSMWGEGRALDLKKGGKPAGKGGEQASLAGSISNGTVSKEGKGLVGLGETAVQNGAGAASQTVSSAAEVVVDVGKGKLANSAAVKDSKQAKRVLKSKKEEKFILKKAKRAKFKE